MKMKRRLERIWEREPCHNPLQLCQWGLSLDRLFKCLNSAWDYVKL